MQSDESEADALARELLEEVGLREVTVGPCLWIREHWFAGLADHGGQSERIFLVRTPRFDPVPAIGHQLLAQEGVTDIRWWTVDEVTRSAESFAPRRLPALLAELMRAGPPPAPIDVGV